LRYELGDVVELARPDESCGCGRGLSMIRAMSGRNNDLVYKPNGEPVHAELFDYAMRQQPGVRRYRIVQEELSSIDILVHMREPMDAGTLERDIVTRLRPFLGDELRIAVRQVEELTPLPSGKFQWVVSKVRAGAAAARR
jgi:phenylacetate-CoA ligase